MPSTCTVSGNIQDLTGSNIAGYAEFQLMGYSTNLPRVIGTTTICTRVQFVQASASGVISTQIWGNDNIDPSGTFYYVTITDASRTQIASYSFNITGSSFNLNSATPITTAPVVTPPTGDTTYQRLDGGNKPTGSYVPNTTNTIDLGAAASAWRNIYGAAFISSSANPAQSGAFRLANLNRVNGRNNANSADLVLLSVGSNDVITVGDAAGITMQGNIDIRGNNIVHSGAPATMGMTLKKGTGAGNYDTASTTYVRADTTNLVFTVTIPTNWKLSAFATGSATTLTAAVAWNIALADGTSDNTGILAEVQGTSAGAGIASPFAVSTVVTGDGNSHTLNLQFKTSNAADHANIANGTTTIAPMMVLTLMPSN